MVKEQRKMDRRNFSYYMPLEDAATTRPLGVMMDIGLGGFKLDSREPIPNGQVNHFRLNLTNDIAAQSSLVFTGRSKWCINDNIDPSVYNVGYELVSISPDDRLIFQRVFEKYGSQSNGNGINNYDYLWK